MFCIFCGQENIDEAKFCSSCGKILDKGEGADALLESLTQMEPKLNSKKLYCKNCGNEIDEKAVICPHCGVSQINKPAVIDNGGFGWGLLGFFIPIVGLILFLVWNDTKPKTSKSAGTGALVSVILWVPFYTLMLL